MVHHAEADDLAESLTHHDGIQLIGERTRLLTSGYITHVIDIPVTLNGPQGLDGNAHAVAEIDRGGSYSVCNAMAEWVQAVVALSLNQSQASS